VPGSAIASQTFGDLLGFNPHCHVLCTDGCFDERALFQVAPRFVLEGLRAIFLEGGVESLELDGCPDTLHSLKGSSIQGLRFTIGGKSCKVMGWIMDARTGVSEIKFLVP